MTLKTATEFFLSHKEEYKRHDFFYYDGSKFYLSQFYCVRVDYEDYYRCLKNCLWDDIRKTKKYFVLKVSGKKVTKLFRLLKWDYTVTEWIEK